MFRSQHYIYYLARKHFCDLNETLTMDPSQRFCDACNDFVTVQILVSKDYDIKVFEVIVL